MTDNNRDVLRKLSLPHIRPFASKQRIIVLGGIAVCLIIAGGLLVTLLLPRSPASANHILRVGTTAPDFTLQNYATTQHALVNLKSYRGKAVLLNFWSESCPPCRAEAPLLAQAYARYAMQQNFIILGVDQSDPPGDIAGFGQAYDIQYPLLFDPNTTVNEAYNVTALPASYFIDRNGIIRAAIVSQLNQSLLQREMKTIGVNMGAVT